MPQLLGPGAGVGPPGGRRDQLPCYLPTFARLIPRRPAWRIRRCTVHRATVWPCRRSSVWTLRAVLPSSLRAKWVTATAIKAVIGQRKYIPAGTASYSAMSYYAQRVYNACRNFIRS